MTEDLELGYGSSSREHEWLFLRANELVVILRHYGFAKATYFCLALKLQDNDRICTPRLFVYNLRF
jgi:hypothetical protein